MSLWGNKEYLALTGTVATTTGDATVTGTTTEFLTEVSNGDTIVIGANTYVVLSVTDDLALELTSNALANASGVTARVAQKPKYLSDTEKKTQTFGVDEVEAGVAGNKGMGHAGWVKVTKGTGYVQGVTITEAGSGYASAPTVTFSAGAATGTAVLTTGSVSSVTMTDNGVYVTDVDSAPTVSFAAPAAVNFDGITAVGSNTITFVSHPFKNGDLVTYANPTANSDIATEGPYYIINATATTVQLSLTAGGAAATLTDSNGSGNHTLTGVTATGDVVMGGRFGRVVKETIVAMGVPAATMGDAEDTQFPDA